MSVAKSGPESRLTQLLLLPFFILATFILYGGILGHEFIFNWDDNVYVTGNEAIRSFSLANLSRAFSDFFVGNYAPLHIVSYMIDYSLWGLNPKGYLLGNLLLHGLNAFLVCRLFLLLDGRLPVALTAAVLFLAHPAQVESVAWISERKTLLSMLFFLLAFHSYIRYCRASGSNRRTWYALSLLAFCAALLSKAVAVILPLVCFAYDWYRQGLKQAGKELLNKIPFIVLSAVLTLVTLFSQRSADGISGYAGGTPLTSAMTMLPVFARYLGKIFWPAGLGPIYKPPIKTAPDMEVFLSLLLFAAVAGVAIYLLQRLRLAGFALTLFLLGFLPVAHIFPLATLMQDRYLYFPLLGFALFVAVAATDSAQKLAGGRGMRFSVVCLLLAAVLLGGATRQQIPVWRNAVTLWAHAAENTPLSKQAWLMLAITHHDLGDAVAAEKAYLRLLSIAPKDGKGLNGIGILYGEQGDIDKSIHYLRQAFEVAPDDPGTAINFGYAALLKGNLAESRDAFNRAVTTAPETLARLLPTMIEIARRQNDSEAVKRLEALQDVRQ